MYLNKFVKSSQERKFQTVQVGLEQKERVGFNSETKIIETFAPLKIQSKRSGIKYIRGI